MPLEVKKGSELRGRYVISDLLGSGAFGVVWRATDKQEGRDVAIKRMLKLGGDELKRLLSEAEKTSKLKNHKNIVEMYEVFEEDGEGFLVMEYVDGGSLDQIFKQHIRDKTWLDLDDSLEYFKQILNGLVFAHSSGIFHRDVTPSNILVSKLDVVKLVDFGLARRVFVAPPAYDPQPGFAWTGNPNFMSPEQAGGEELDHLTDIFSAGIVGYILVTGRHPFNHPSGVATVFELIKDPSFACEDLIPGSIKGLSDGAVRALTGMLQKDKAKRYQSLIGPITELSKDVAQLCSRCGSPNPMSNNFCGICGNNLKPPPPDQGGIDGEPPGLPQPSEPGGPSSSLSAERLTDAGFREAQRDNWVGAIKYYQEAIGRDPLHGRAYSNLGFALNRLGKYAEAIDVLSKGIECSTDPVVLHRLYDTRGFARSNLKEYAAAIDDFSAALQYNSNNPRIYYHRAESEAFAGEYERSYSDVLRALKLNPTYESALRLKSRLETQGFVKPLMPTGRF